jgi:hypothetical protein
MWLGGPNMDQIDWICISRVIPRLVSWQCPFWPHLPSWASLGKSCRAVFALYPSPCHWSSRVYEPQLLEELTPSMTFYPQLLLQPWVLGARQQMEGFELQSQNLLYRPAHLSATQCWVRTRVLGDL